MFMCNVSDLALVYFPPGNSSPPNSIEDAYYEDADNNYPTTRINGPRQNSCEQTTVWQTSCFANTCSVVSI